MTNIEETLAEANKGAAVNVLSGICDIINQWDEQGKEIERLRERCGDLERELKRAYDKLDRVGNKLIDMAQIPAPADPETAGNASPNGDGCQDPGIDGDLATETSRESDIGRERPEDGADEDNVLNPSSDVPDDGDSWEQWFEDYDIPSSVDYCDRRGIHLNSVAFCFSARDNDLKRRAKKLARLER